MSEDRFDWSQCLEYVASSDVGMRRANNQDAVMTSLASSMSLWRQQGHLFMVADGMGAHAAGELASQMAVDSVTHAYRKQRHLAPPDALVAAVREANATIFRRGRENPEFHNMGTTGSLLLLLPQGALAAHVGDSRIYRLRNQQLAQLTFDHSLAWEMEATGQVSRDDAAAIPRNVITRSLGPHPHVKVDLEGPLAIDPGDTFLLCSDGLTGRVDDQEIAAALAYVPPRKAAELLTDLANLRGGPDNISVIVIRITGSELVAERQQSQPLTVGGRLESLPVLPLISWVVTSFFFLLALVFAAAALPISWSLVSAGAGLLGAGWMLVRKFSPAPENTVSLEGGRHLGKGPYSTTSAISRHKFTEHLESVFNASRAAAVDRDWPVVWAPVNTFHQQAQAATKAGDHQQAINYLGQALRLLADEFKREVRGGMSQQ